MKSRVRQAASILLLAAIYFASGFFGLSMAFLNKSATAVWPPTGLALAALLFWGYRLWPAIFIGAFTVNLLTQGTITTSLGIAAGNTLEAVIGAWLVNRFAAGLRAFERTGTFFRYVLAAAIFSTAISATVGVGTLCLNGFSKWDEFGEVWLTWWLGDMTSNILIAPLLIIWGTQPVRVRPSTRLAEASGLLLLLLLISGSVFLMGTPFTGLHPSLEYLAVPPLLWAAFRFGERGAITSATIVAGMALWATLHGRGPFANQDPNRSLLLLQVFMGAITLTALVLALVVSESRRAEQRLQIQEAVSRGLAEAPTLSAAAPKILQALCQEANWEVSAIWLLDQASGDLACAEVWHVPNADTAAFAKRTRELRIGRGVGLLGRVWKTGKPVFVPELNADPTFQRGPEALKAGLRAAFVFPINMVADVPGMIEGFSRHTRAPEEESKNLLEAIGSQVGQFIERKKAESAQARLAAIVESSADAIIGKTLDGIITSWNEGAVRIFGYASSEVIGKPVTLLCPPELETEQRDILARVRRGERIRSYHTKRLSKHGELMDVSLTVSPITDVAGKIIGASKIARDVTEQMRTERALAEAREMLRRHADDLERRVEERTSKLQETIKSLDAFCYTIAHDLRAPLRAMIGFSVELLERYEGLLEQEGKTYLQRIRHAGARMDQLILDLLKLGRLNTADLVIEEVDLEETLRKVLAELQNEIKLKQAQIQIQQPLLRVQASTVILEQVLDNLVSNALKFVPAHSQPIVKIWAEGRNGKVRLWIRDNGIGIKSQYLNKLFQPFSRLVSDQDFPGTGIGLAIVSKGMERMGGEAGVESEPEKGSSFWIELAGCDEDS
jgi:PAS domain S-box-containing protein